MAPVEKFLTYKDATAQSLKTCHTDPVAILQSDKFGAERCLTVYTGNLHLGLRRGEDTEHYKIFYPVLGAFPHPPPPAPQIVMDLGIQDIDPNREFGGAVAMMSIVEATQISNSATCQIANVRADLYNVVLARIQQTISAVVLTAEIQVRNAHLDEVQYHVTMLTRVLQTTDRVHTYPFLKPPHFPSEVAGWDGVYAIIRPALKSGILNENNVLPL
jgi:hypothetical protein